MQANRITNCMFKSAELRNPASIVTPHLMKAAVPFHNDTRNIDIEIVLSIQQPFGWLHNDECRKLIEIKQCASRV